MSLARQIKSAEESGLALAAIQIDGGTQSRATLNQQVVDDYAEAIKAGTAFPPIVVFYDGKKHWLADGFHRFHAHQKAGKSKVAADVRQGTRRDAILHSVGANEAHGLRRTNDDKRRAVLTLLNDAEWSKWSDREIARQCAVSPDTVGRIRKEIAPVTVQSDSEDRTYTTKHGTTATMKTAGINASRTQFQAKASEDNGSITGGAGAVTGEASRLASGRTDAGEAASADLPTNSDAVGDTDAIERAWKHGYLIGFGSSSEGYNAEYPFDGDVESDPGWLKSRDLAFAANRSAIINSPSDGDAFSEVKGTARPENAAGVEPSSSDIPFPSAAISAVAVAEPQAPQAKSATAPHSVTPPPPGGTEKGGGALPPAPSPAHRWSSLRPHCLNPELCAGVGAKHCHACEKAMAGSEAA